MIKKLIFIFLFSFSSLAFSAEAIIKPGAEQTSAYLPLLKDKRVGVFANQTSMVGHKHLIDVLIKHGIHVTKIFSPEHGFRGDASDGVKIKNSVDSKTGIPIISLYGKKVSPSAADLKDVDILVFDIQDVGVSFYTFISSLQRLMEAAIKYNKPLIILDRPNPNGFYVDGPVNKKSHSFTGLQPIPTVYGMTMGEYAKMLVGEEWLDVTPKSRSKDLKLTIIRNVNYTHNSLYIPPVKPSPNLPDIQSIYLYAPIGIMEDSAISVGRGTETPFQVFGSPVLKNKFTFIPSPKPGAAENPQYNNKICHGWDLRGTQQEVLKKIDGKLQIKYILMAYHAYPDKKYFFGSDNIKDKKSLMGEVVAGMSEAQIRKSWEPRLSAFKKIRKKYLLYPDFTGSI